MVTYRVKWVNPNNTSENLHTDVSAIGQCALFTKLAEWDVTILSVTIRYSGNGS